MLIMQNTSISVMIIMQNGTNNANRGGFKHISSDKHPK
uniref:Uncharacterized protein n=1 Tax=Onchocerca volvulus TaxID=6282 RepID=A0A8R1XWP5_ONCVO